MDITANDLSIEHLGECRFDSPLRETRFTAEAESVLVHNRWARIRDCLDRGEIPPAFEMAGPRRRIFFDPTRLKCGIVTCGGLCPGLNDVIRSIVLSLHFHYGVRTIYGFRYGYEGLSPEYKHPPLELTVAGVADIHQKGGTILGSSRGAQNIEEMVATLVQYQVGVLFTIGGDGTLRGARALATEIKHRGLEIAVIGIPKTIDNDISWIESSFGFETAVSEASKVIYSANSEAVGARNGIGLVKLMGRESGFIPAFATLANNDVNFCLIPEVPFSLDQLLHDLEVRLRRRKHAVIVVGEGAGQDLLAATAERDKSGNIQFGDIGLFLKQKISEYFRAIGMEFTLKYIDPSYIIRSQPANPHDSAFCLLLGHQAVHAAMTGRTAMVVGVWNREFTHVPIELAVSRRKQIDPHGRIWQHVLSSTGQPTDT